MTTKICGECGIEKDIREYPNNNICKDGVTKKCKMCTKRYKKQYYKNNKDIINARCKKYRLNNRSTRRLFVNKYCKQRRKTDINFKIMVNIRSRIGNAINSNTKADRSIKLLGCSITDYKKHLESKFKPGMNWNNYGKKGWHIDHIIPCDLFDMSNPNEQRKCFNYKNTQPLWWYENIAKLNHLNWKPKAA